MNSTRMRKMNIKKKSKSKRKLRRKLRGELKLKKNNHNLKFSNQLNRLIRPKKKLLRLRQKQLDKLLDNK